MSVVEDLDKLISLKEASTFVVDLESFVTILKSYLRRKLGKCFCKVVFDKTDQDQGMVFVKVSAVPWKDSEPDTINNSPCKFIIAVSGFNGNGEVTESSYHDVDMYVCDGVRRIRAKRFYGLDEAKRHLLRYFEKYCDKIAESVGAGTASGAVGSGVGGVSRTEGDIAVRPVRMKMGSSVVKRFDKKDEKY